MQEIAGFTPREYQVEARKAIRREFEVVRSTLLCLPTGTGKTCVIADLIRDMQPCRTMFLAHREELIFQARNTISSITGLEVEIEMGELRARTGTLFAEAPVIVSTVQTQNAGLGGQFGGKRMGKFKPEDFSLLVIDEAHHSTAASYRSLISYYTQNPKLRVLGVTATPDRADEEALGQVFESVAMDYEILDAIHDGWLVDVKQLLVPVAGLDFSHMRTTAGDLNQGDLAAVMETERSIQGVVQPTLEAAWKLEQRTLDRVPVPEWGAYLAAQDTKPKRTLVFTVSVKQAESLCNIFNRVREGMAAWVCGETNRDHRRETLQGYNNGKFTIIVNCQCLGEGWDSPAVELVVQAKPTKSRCVYAQQIGRGTRPLPGVVDGVFSAEARRESIALSAKPCVTVLDFVGNSGKHKLMTTADILGGKVSEAALERAVNAVKKQGGAVSMVAALDEAEEQLRAEALARRQAEEARKAKLVARSNFTTQLVNPFDLLQISPSKEKGWDTGRTLSEKQRQLLARQGIDADSMPYGQAKQVINELFRRWDSNVCSFKQAQLLRKYARVIGKEPNDKTLVNISRQEASRLIDQIATKQGWAKKAKGQPVGAV